jgi:hypothetical protein
MKTSLLTAIIIDDEQEAINGLLALVKDIKNLEIAGKPPSPKKPLTFA